MHEILIVGTGSIGERHLRCFLATGRARVAVCEIDAELRSRIESSYPVSRIDAGFPEALSASPEAVVIATPAHLHVAMALEAASAGCHLLIEKPLSIGFEGVPELGEMVVHRQLVAHVAYVLRHYPVVAALKHALEKNSLGKPLHLTAVSGQHFPTCRPAYGDVYYARHETGGGAIQDSLTHLLDAGQWFLGPITRFTGDAAHLCLPGVEVEDTVNVLARHGDIMASYHLNQHQYPDETTITVVSGKGTLRAELHEKRLRFMDRPGDAWKDTAWPDFKRDDAFVTQANVFLDAIEGASAESCSLSEAGHTLRCQRALLATALGSADWKRVETPDNAVYERTRH